MKKGIEIIVVLLIIAGGVFAWNVYKQQQTMRRFPMHSLVTLILLLRKTK